MSAIRRRWVVGVLSVAMLSVLGNVAAGAAPHRHPRSAVPAGCNLAGAPIAHYADQRVRAPQPRGGPWVCGSKTGWPAVENRIEVTNDNTVIYEPALQSGPGGVLGGDGHVPGNGKEQSVARTSDNGARWTATSVQVWPDSYVLDNQVDNNIFVDHATNRFFWYMYSPGPTGAPGYQCGGAGGTVAYSDDNGTTWTWGVDHDHACSENPTVVSAAESVPGEQISYGSPATRRIVYLCGDNTSTGAGGTGTLGFSCSKSLDGGATWLGTTLGGQDFYSGMHRDMTNPYPQCGGQSSSAGADVQPLPNGTLAVVMACDAKTFLVESKDEGASWRVTNQLPHGGDLRIDSAGNMYLLECRGPQSSPLGSCNSGATPELPGRADPAAKSALLLSHSTDGGARWSTPVNMVAPGVTSVGTYYFVQGTFDDGLVGDVAVAYYGIAPKSPDGKNGYTDGYITATRDALTKDRNGPTFWSGQVNPPGRPLLYNTATDGNIGITVLDFNGGAWSPDGRSVWGSWVQDCGPDVTSSPSCTSRYPAINPGDPDEGYAGHLTWPTADR